MQNYYEYVKTAESQLKAEGVPLSGPIGDAEESDHQKGLLTARTAWLIYPHDGTVGLQQKLGGANWQGRSSDRLCERFTGNTVDICSTRDDPATGKFYVTTGWNEDDAPVNPDWWIEPTAEMSNAGTGSGGGGGNGGGGGSDDQFEQIIQMLERAEEVQARDTAAIIARSDLNAQRILDRLDQIVQMFEEGAQKVLAIWLAQNAGGEAPPGEELPPGEGNNALLLLLLKLLAGQQPTAAAVAAPKPPAKKKPTPQDHRDHSTKTKKK